MNRFTSFLAVAIMGVALAACGTELQKAENLAPEGNEFTAGMYGGYLELSESEYGEGNYRQSDVFAKQAMRSASGETVLPNEPDPSRLAEYKVGEMTAARDRLLTALDDGGREEEPTLAALSQATYECWLHEQTEGWQLDQIEACKADYFAAINDLEVAMAPEPVAAAAVVATAAVVEDIRALAYFDFDSSAISTEGQQAIDVIIAEAEANPSKTIRIVAHTDTVGPVDYNQSLSERRANAVIGSLIQGGVAPDRIVSEAVGKTQPLVDTGDQVRSQANRVAVIDLL
ncbi:MAG: OmpA family protein [Pseudomonadota bacterium]